MPSNANAAAMLSIVYLFLNLTLAGNSFAQNPSASPWTESLKSAVVRIEAPAGTGRTSVGAGAIIRGLGGIHYILTSTHVVVPLAATTQVSPNSCIPLPENTRMFQGNSGGFELRARCAYHLGDDVSIVELLPRDTPRYPEIGLISIDLVEGDIVHLAGFPLGYDRDTSQKGKVRVTRGEDGTIVTDLLTAEGMSGGPYLSKEGKIVGIHRGGPRFVSGFAHMVPIWRVRHLLEARVPQIPVGRGSAPLPELVVGERTILLDGFKDFGRASFVFQSRQVVSWGDLRGDIGVTNTGSNPPRDSFASFFLPYDAPPYIDARRARAGIAVAPVQDLTNANDCSSVSTFAYHWFKPALYSVYCVRTRDGKSYAKIHVVHHKDDSIGFDWIYQPPASE